MLTGVELTDLQYILKQIGADLHPITVLANPGCTTYTSHDCFNICYI